jgi:hypothetical protein
MVPRQLPEATVQVASLFKPIKREETLPKMETINSLFSQF